MAQAFNQITAVSLQHSNSQPSAGCILCSQQVVPLGPSLPQAPTCKSQHSMPHCMQVCVHLAHSLISKVSHNFKALRTLNRNQLQPAADAQLPDKTTAQFADWFHLLRQLSVMQAAKGDQQSCKHHQQQPAAKVDLKPSSSTCAHNTQLQHCQKLPHVGHTHTMPHITENRVTPAR